MKQLFALASLLVPLAACNSSSTPCTAASAGSPVTAVSISDYQFTPQCFAVAKGTTVTFTNNGPSAHTATTLSGPVSFDSGTLNSGKTFAQAFGTAGTIDLHCNFHPAMTATAIVQ